MRAPSITSSAGLAAASSGEGAAGGAVSDATRGYRISTITAFSKIASSIDMQRLFESAADKGCGSERVAFLSLSLNDDSKQLSENVDSTIHRRARKTRKPKDSSTTTSAPKKKNFGNQITLLLGVDGNPVNIKLFKNGSVQVAGIRHLVDWTEIATCLTRWMKQSNIVGNVLEDATVIDSLKVCMICSDFDINTKFRPVKLLEVLRAELPLLLSSHEACRHPAVKIKYMHNMDDDQDARDGVCKCETACGGRGDGLTRASSCRKVTILMFHSGKVVITGAVTLQQVKDAHRFVVEDIVASRRGRFQLPPTQPI